MHFHWLVWAHQGTQNTPLPGGGTNSTYVDVVEIDVIADCEDEALEKAERLAPEREAYLLKKISEHESHT
jgi:hypothetical protein